jgi:hypothetical protein
VESKIKLEFCNIGNSQPREDHHQNKLCSLAQDGEKSQYRFFYHTGWRAGTTFRRQLVSATSESRRYYGGMQFFRCTLVG